MLQITIFYGFYFCKFYLSAVSSGLKRKGDPACRAISKQGLYKVLLRHAQVWKVKYKIVEALVGFQTYKLIMCLELQRRRMYFEKIAPTNEKFTLQHRSWELFDRTEVPRHNGMSYATHKISSGWLSSNCSISIHFET